jgi:hypothetical protein
MNEWVYYRGGPKEGHVLLGKEDHDGLLLFDSPREAAYYKLTAETVNTDKGRIPVAEFIGHKPPAES